MTEALPLTTIGVVVLLAFGIGVILKRLGQNSVLGYIFAGILLGPLGFAFLEPGSGLAYAFGEIGLFVLLFYLGIELSLKKFLSTGATATVLAFVDMLALTGGGTLLMLALGYSTLFSLTVGIMLFCTSTAVVAKFIFDKKLNENPGALLALAILIMQDFLALLLLIFLSGVSASGSAWSIGLSAVVFVVAAFTVVRQLSVRVEAWLKNNGFGHSETTLYALGIGLFAAMVGGIFGLSAGLGAYFAGFALSETSAGNRIKTDLGFLREFFLLFFFVGFGTLLFYNPATGLAALPGIDSLAILVGLVAVLVAVIYLANFAVFGFIGRKMGLSNENASLGALLLTPIGEFAVIVATAVAAVLPAQESQLILSVAFLLILASVLSFQPAYSLREHHERFMARLPFKRAETQSEIVPHSPDSLRNAKGLALNVFIIVCLIAVAFFIYDQGPTFNVPIPYSRVVTAGVALILFSIYPVTRAAKYFRRLVNQKQFRAAATSPAHKRRKRK
ncbi:hypothetical protein AUJ14_03255 [Candidatus Micrarchaeota archaeon CG1_02_55_22]|nr:MAG: hypothetical protein AUJ14_03255 [Candidatus Micrarchaeota archaeon CG1_02_55_22]